MWKEEKEKLNKSGRKWKETKEGNYNDVYLFCEQCGKLLGEYSVYGTDLQSTMYCENCVKKYIKSTPINLSCGVILNDYGNSVDLEYTGNSYKTMVVNKICYFNDKGRSIKVKGKRFYL